jgi:hypothetical protein
MLTVYVIDPKDPNRPRKLDAPVSIPEGTAIDQMLNDAKEALRGRGYIVRSVNATLGHKVVAYVYEPGNAPPGSPRGGMSVWSPPTRPRSS